MRPETDDNDLFPNLAIIDLEASGLHRTSFPIEVGWCFGNLCSGSMLIRPHDNWTEADWRPASERIHGITLATCREEGIDAEEVATRLNRILGGMHVVSDSLRYDEMWLERLYWDTGTLREFEIRPLEQVIFGLRKRAGEDRYNATRHIIQKLFPYTHRAADDARNMMALLCALERPDLLEHWRVTLPADRPATDDEAAPERE